MIPGILTAIGFYLIPLLIGAALQRSQHEEMKDPLEKWIEQSATAFMLGAILLYAITLIDRYILKGHLITNDIFLGITLSGISLSIGYKILNRRKLYTAKNLRYYAYLGVIVLFNIGIYLIWKLNTPYTATLNWDLYHQQNVINSIVANKFEYSPNKMSDSFGFTSYSTVFHLLAAIPFRIWKPDTLHFWYLIEYFHLMTTSLISYYVTKVFTRNRGISFLSAFVSPLLFESLGAYTTLFWIPQNLVATLAAFSIAKIVKYKDIQNKVDMPFTLIAALFLIPTHYIIGTLGTAIMVESLIFLMIHKFNGKIANLIIYIGILSYLLLPKLSNIINLDNINHGEAASFNYTGLEKVEFFITAYGITPFVIALFGIFLIMRDKSIYNNELKTLVLINITFFAILIAPLPYVLKLYSIGRYFFIALFLYGLRTIYKKISTRSLITITILLGAMLFTTFILNITRYKQTPEYKGIYTHISPGEVAAGEYIKSNYNSKTLLISDPTTMQLLEGISGVNSPGGAFATKETRKILSDTYLTRDTQSDHLFWEVEDGVQKKNFDKRILVVSGRYEEWQKLGEFEKQGIVENIWKPKDLNYDNWKENSYVSYLLKDTNFKLVYKNPEVFVFEIQPPTLIK